MNSYEVLADGYHSPLTKTQISELFQAGRLGRHHPCRQVGGKAWRTIDELFPLLKYETSTISNEQSAETPRARILMLLLFMVPATAGAILWFCSANNAAGPVERADRTTTNWPKTISSAAAPPSNDVARASQPQATPEEVNRTTTVPANSAEAPSEIFDSQQTRLAQERQNAEQRQREQAQATQERLMAERAELERKAAGRDVIIPLGEFRVVHNVGGMDVNVKILDNDVTSFDVWIDGRWQREVLKQKGLTGSRTDETLIYTNGRARLYYVWEISGRLNHCRLRVRD